MMRPKQRHKASMTAASTNHGGVVYRAIRPESSPALLVPEPSLPGDRRRTLLRRRGGGPRLAGERRGEDDVSPTANPVCFRTLCCLFRRQLQSPSRPPERPEAVGNIRKQSGAPVLMDVLFGSEQQLGIMGAAAAWRVFFLLFFFAVTLNSFQLSRWWLFARE